jgi:hypothetical protein
MNIPNYMKLTLNDYLEYRTLQESINKASEFPLHANTPLIHRFPVDVIVEFDDGVFKIRPCAVQSNSFRCFHSQDIGLQHFLLHYNQDKVPVPKNPVEEAKQLEIVTKETVMNNDSLLVVINDQQESLTVKHLLKNILGLSTLVSDLCETFPFYVRLKENTPVFPISKCLLPPNPPSISVATDTGMATIVSFLQKLQQKETNMPTEPTNQKQESTGPVEYFIQVCNLGDYKALFPELSLEEYKISCSRPTLFNSLYYHLTHLPLLEDCQSADVMISGAVHRRMDDKEVLDIHLHTPSLMHDVQSLKVNLNRQFQMREKTSLHKKLGAIKKACDERCAKAIMIDQVISVQLTSSGVSELYEYYKAHYLEGEKQFFLDVDERGVLSVAPSVLTYLRERVDFTVNNFVIPE